MTRDGCDGPIPTEARHCPWCEAALGPEESRPSNGDPADLVCPACGRTPLEADEDGQQTEISRDLYRQRRRFIAALDQRERARQEALPEARDRARGRERLLSLTLDIAEESNLVLKNGLVIKHVAELACCLDQLPIEVFRWHVSDFRNDFARWVLDVFDDPTLAERMRGIREPRRLQLEIYRYLAGREPGDPD